MKVLTVLCTMTLMLLLGLRADAQPHPGRGAPNVRDSVYRVRCRVTYFDRQPTPPPAKHELGTAFGHRSGNVISASHVLEPCLKARAEGERKTKGKSVKVDLRLADASGTESSAEVVLSDAAIDLVLLKPDAGFVKNPLPVTASNMLTIGDPVSFWGFPSGYSGAFALLGVGNLAGSQSDPKVASVNRWVINGAFNPGNSGGPLLDTNSTATVIGVVIQKWTPLSDEVRSELKTISEKGSSESRVLAKAMLQTADSTQLVVGHSVLTSDLKSFLRRAGVE